MFETLKAIGKALLTCCVGFAIVGLVVGLAVLIWYAGPTDNSHVDLDPYGNFNKIHGIHTTVTVTRDSAGTVKTPGIRDGVLYLMCDADFAINSATFETLKQVSRTMLDYKLEAVSIQFRNHAVIKLSEFDAEKLLYGSEGMHYLNVLFNRSRR